ncbi:hypothetical protein P3X46_035032 [Hevea brasiliensis]|uniref:peptidylprolyl isomerase n=1 Tax=Hevea brasiliensis TaxID=3981 RepID=A0ABQ9K8F4_HEVBR|nr:hypothetical protein P3X46_035032 [Hevea brasiliensis]
MVVRNNVGFLLDSYNRIGFWIPTAMASMSSFERWTVNRLQIVSKSTAKQTQEPSKLFLLPVPTSRRCAILISALPLGLILLPPLSEARERRNKKAIPLEDYLTTSDGLKYYDVVKGKGPIAEKGLTVLVHFDCLYRVITAVSIGAPPGKERKREFVDNPNGLFSAQAAPKPPTAMYSVTQGMKRTVIVPPEAGYGQKGMNEIPPGATLEINIELLQVMPAEEK